MLNAACPSKKYSTILVPATIVCLNWKCAIHFGAILRQPELKLKHIFSNQARFSNLTNINFKNINYSFCFKHHRTKQNLPFPKREIFIILIMISAIS